MQMLIPLIVGLIPDSWKAWLSGKKTYICAIILALTAAAEALGYTVPAWVYVLEGSLGLGAMRVAISKGGAPYVAPKE